MIRNRKMKIMLCVMAAVLMVFQGLIIGVAAPMGYYLIHEWIFYVINYVIIIMFLLLYSKNHFVRWTQMILGLILLVSNSTFFYYMGDVNVVVSKSKDHQHEVILKEYKKMSNETIRLKRRGVLFGKKVATLMGSSTYKTLEEETYKIDWVSGDTAVVTYQVSEKGTLHQSIFNFRSSNYVSYQNVAVSLTGKWFEQENPQNYFMYDAGEIIYAKDGQLYYYRNEDSEQQGIFSIVIKGDENKPSFTVVLNSDSVFGDDGLIKDGGTITIYPVTLKELEGKVYYRK
ncbi:hypothetical protein [Bacillus sp. FJAT-42315]|uniref:hypothetical protein n=1 Tax=Bacillus sp. FJAT-42315 TaxID=2014077 RepID=UPI000C23FE58|nr:hypothetical protein [Bacillus sp. FJAT-42315]